MRVSATWSTLREAARSQVMTDRRRALADAHVVLIREIRAAGGSDGAVHRAAQQLAEGLGFRVPDGFFPALRAAESCALRGSVGEPLSSTNATLAIQVLDGFSRRLAYARDVRDRAADKPSPPTSPPRPRPSVAPQVAMDGEASTAPISGSASSTETRRQLSQVIVLIRETRGQSQEAFERKYGAWLERLLALPDPQTREEVLGLFAPLRQYADRGSELERQGALVTAQALVERLLRRRGYKERGSSLRSALEAAARAVGVELSPGLNDAIDRRNRAAHGPNIPTSSSALVAVAVFEATYLKLMSVQPRLDTRPASRAPVRGSAASPPVLPAGQLTQTAQPISRIPFHSRPSDGALVARLAIVLMLALESVAFWTWSDELAALFFFDYDHVASWAYEHAPDDTPRPARSLGDSWDNVERSFVALVGFLFLLLIGSIAWLLAGIVGGIVMLKLPSIGAAGLALWVLIEG